MNTNDSGKDFWLSQFAYTDGKAVYFDFVDEIRANVPYLIATPGNNWGEEYNLLNKTIAFMADNVNIPQTSKLKSMTDAFVFVGLSEKKNVSGYVLDDNGQFFVSKEDVSQNAFRAYFIATSTPSSMGDVNGDGEINITDVIFMVNHILGISNDNFIFANADMDKNGEIDISDVVSLVNIILNGTGNQTKLKVLINGADDFTFGGVGN